MKQNFRPSRPRNVQYKELEQSIDAYYDQLRRGNKQLSEKHLTQIRKHVLTKGCSEQDLVFDNNDPTIPESTGNNQTAVQLKRLQSLQHNPTDKLLKIGKALPTIRKVEDTLRGRLWRTMIGTPSFNYNDYQKQISKREYIPTYTRLRGDTKRTFAASEEYMSRVSEERLVRILNSYSQKYDRPYCQGLNVVAGGLLYVMPELDAYHTLCILCEKHCRTYWYSDNSHQKDLSGAWAGSFLAWDILREVDKEVWNHLRTVPPHMYLFPLMVGMQSVARPFTELMRLWDFLFCFGLHLNPIVCAAQIVLNRAHILRVPSTRALLSGILSQLKWMNGTLNARKTIACSMELIIKLKTNNELKDLWFNILNHASNFEVAQNIRMYHESELKIAMFGSGATGTVTGSQLNALGGPMSPSATSDDSTRNPKEMDFEDDDFSSLAKLSTKRQENINNNSNNSNNSNNNNAKSPKRNKNQNNRKSTNSSNHNIDENKATTDE